MSTLTCTDCGREFVGRSRKNPHCPACREKHARHYRELAHRRKARAHQPPAEPREAPVEHAARSTITGAAAYVLTALIVIVAGVIMGILDFGRDQ